VRRLSIALLLATAAVAAVASPALAADTAKPTAVLDAPTTVSFGSAIGLSGIRSSDAGGGHIVEYRWTVGPRPVVVTPDPTFNSPAGLAPGRYDVSLVVVDDSGNVSSADTRPVIVRDNSAPTAVLDAPSSVAAGESIPLSGARSSDLGGRVTEYRWTVGTRPVVVTSDNTFTAAALPAGRHALSLVVVDDAGNQSASTATSVFVGDDIAPTAVLEAPSTVSIGASIPLSGARSTDARGRIVRYRWTVDAQPPVETADPAFTAASLPLGAHTVSLVVTDDAGNESAPDTKQVIVRDDIAPTAVLTAPATAAAGAAIALSGARSFDGGGRIVRYRWVVGTRAPVETADSAFTAPGLAAGRHTLSLVVTDDSGNESTPTTASIDVTAPPPPPAPRPPAGTKLTTFGKVTLIAPLGKKTAQIDLRKGTLLAGRVFSPVAVVLTSEFAAGKLKLGKSSVRLKAGGVAQLGIKLSRQARKALKGRKTVKLAVKSSARERATGKTTTTTRNVTFTVT
jgi:PKD repeat protein